MITDWCGIASITLSTLALLMILRSAQVDFDVLK